MDEDGAVCFLGCSKVLFESTAGELLLRAPQPPSGHIVQLLHCPSGSAGWRALVLSGKQMHSLKHPQAADGLLVLCPTKSLSSFLPQLPREPTASEAANLHSHLNWTFQHIPEELWMDFSLASAEELRGEQGTRSSCSGWVSPASQAFSSEAPGAASLPRAWAKGSDSCAAIRGCWSLQLLLWDGQGFLGTCFFCLPHPPVNTQHINTNKTQ